MPLDAAVQKGTLSFANRVGSKLFSMVVLCPNAPQTSLPYKATDFTRESNSFMYILGEIEVPKRVFFMAK